MDLPFDRYTIQARLSPMFVTLLPASFAVAVWIPTGSAVWNYLGTVFISFPLTALLAQLGRELGRNKERQLFRLWGGTPTTRLLSHRLSTLNPLTLQRCHQKLASLLPDLSFPGPTEESANPAAANQVYDSCVHFLRERTRDAKQFPLVFAENINYGFRRNLWALRSFGIASAAAGIVSCAFFVLKNSQDGNSSSGVVGLLVSATLLILWLFVFTPSWVRSVAYAYAERLLGVLDNI
jgi:hypothetical protein